MLREPGLVRPLTRGVCPVVSDYGLGASLCGVGSDLQEQDGGTSKSARLALKRELGLFSVFSIAAGAMISSGLFVLPGLAYEKAGPAVVLAYGLASLLILPVMLSKAELATAMPKAGGNYFFIERSLGPLAGSIAGFADWFSVTLKAAFALVGIGALGMLLKEEVAPGFFPQWGEYGLKVTALAACAVFAVLNLVSTKGVGRLQIGLVLMLLAILAAYVFRGVQATEGTRYMPFLPAGWQAVFAVAGMVFVSYGGLTKVVAIGEEVRDPKRNIPLGMFAAFFVVSALYVLAVFVTVGVVDGKDLSGSLVPITLGAKPVLGVWGALVVDFAAFLAFATTANAGILAASRSPMAMSRDGLLPEFLARTNRRFGTPHVAIAFTTAFVMAVIAFLSVEDLVKTASTMMIVTFTLVNVSVIIMRQSGIQNYRPSFRAPLYPWLQIAAIVVYGFLIFEMGAVPLILTGVFALLAMLWYLAYVRPRIERESAFVYMVKGLVSSGISRPDLEDELKQITIERDEIAHDRFDQLVKEAVVLDIEGCMSAKEMFRRIAEAMAPRVGLESERLYNLFIEREKESSTVIRPGVAIPHVVVGGEGIFDLLLVRCRDGVIFSELHPAVTTAFVLVGSKDERNYHLRALMSVAHIVEEAGFQERWQKARGPEELRDLVLLSSRTRVH